jgi:hypothetical protein
VDGHGNIISDKEIVDEVEEPCDPEVCKSAIEKKTAKQKEEENIVKVAIDDVKDMRPPNELGVVATEAPLDEPPKHDDKNIIKSKKNCHPGHQYSKLPKFNYNYKVCDAYIYTFGLD